MVISVISHPSPAMTPNSVLTVDFGDGRIAEYDGSDLEMLDLAYASTIHKSQGSEYKSVIINLQCAHAVMLVRPLVYTAITRAKERVLIVRRAEGVMHCHQAYRYGTARDDALGANQRANLKCERRS